MEIPRHTDVAVAGWGDAAETLTSEFGGTRQTIGYDIQDAAITAFRGNINPAEEIFEEDIEVASGLGCPNDLRGIASADSCMIAVSYPADVVRQLNFAPLVSASQALVRHTRQH